MREARGGRGARSPGGLIAGISSAAGPLRFGTNKFLPPGSDSQEVAMNVSYVNDKAPSRWRVLVALIAALSLEADAVAVASLHKSAPIPVVTGVATEDRAAEVILINEPPEPTPPPDEAPPPIPPPPTDPNEFVLESPTPPPRPRLTQQTKARATSLHRQGASARSASYVSGSANMLAAPHPSYPYEARRSRQTGSGRFLLTFNPSGSVSRVSVIQSTGSQILDQVSVNALRQWKCRPGAYEQAYVPVTFTLQGAQL